MAKKKFEEVEYDPFEQESRRHLARQITAGGVSVAAKLDDPPLVVSSIVPEPAPKEGPLASRVTGTFRDEPANSVPRSLGTHLKSRTFKCASSAQDKELDSFLLRLGEASGTSVPFQVVARAAIAATMRSEEQIVELLRRRPPMRRPATVSATEYAQFEQYWAEVVVEALRKLRPYQYQ